MIIVGEKGNVDKGKQPLVSVVTPVYNGENYLSVCIESVLAQSYKNWEFIIVNNCSTDASAEIAEHYSKNELRIKIVNNDRFLSMQDNWNHAVQQISVKSKYCKMVLADDWILPDCLHAMVEFMEANPSVGIVGAYVLQEDRVMYNGLPYSKPIIEGSELCRRTLLGTIPYILGSPSALQMRSDLIRIEGDLYDVEFHQLLDQTACYKLLRNSDFGFIHQVLSYYRLHPESQSSANAQLQKQAIEEIAFLNKYGPFFLSSRESNQRKKDKINAYYSILAKGLLKLRGRKFWSFHIDKAKRINMPLKASKLSIAIIKEVYKNILLLLLNPRKKLNSLWKTANLMEAK